ncbi:hypothetical protein K461DRAFT_272272 [Myriangium duriaei CBS 260.36]|uniref:Uncharacterized protein n=1 Tax=Myriangium duriaei CBS 260.36 TaxID=1168546 RepID=A0A9P4ITL3_9PEZI|nr:hypothetical protein K461DRAFT_272272 [Myriangium duriaei CBS 260.36]
MTGKMTDVVVCEFLYNYRRTALSPPLAVLGFDASTESEVEAIIESTKGRRYELKAPTTWFQRLCTDATLRAWMEKRAYSRKRMFLITGHLTFADEGVTHTAERGKAYGGKVDIPIVQTATGVETGLPLSVGIDATLDGKIKKDREQIYAIQSRRVNLSWLRANTLGKAASGDNVHGHSVLLRRGAGDDNIVHSELSNALRLNMPRVKVASELGDNDHPVILGR